MSPESPLVVVTGLPDAALGAVPLAERLGCAYVSLAETEDELPVEGEDTPRSCLRLDAEPEIVRRLTELAGVAVLDLAVEPPLEPERVTALVRRWWDDVVEVRCQAPGLRYDGLGAARTVGVDASRPPALRGVAPGGRPG